MTVKEENEEKKEYLNTCKRLNRKVRSLQQQKISIMESMQAAKAIEYSDMPKGHKQSDLSDYIVKLENLFERVSEIENEKKNTITSIERYIARMEDGVECDILRKRYIECKSWATIADEMHYSRQQVYRIHGNALIHFERDE